jgi:hypothetical protein
LFIGGKANTHNRVFRNIKKLNTIFAVAQKLLCREGKVALLQTQELRLSLFGRTGMEFKTTTMEEQTPPLKVEILRCHV